MEPTQGSDNKRMNKENVVHIHTMEFLHKEEWTYVVSRNVGVTKENHIKGIKGLERWFSCYKCVLLFHKT